MLKTPILKFQPSQKVKQVLKLCKLAPPTILFQDDFFKMSYFISDLYSEKQLKDIKLLLTLITFWNIIFKQIIFVIDRIITMRFTKMQIEIHGSLVTIQYYTKCTDPLYPKFTSKKI